MQPLKEHFLRLKGKILSPLMEETPHSSLHDGQVALKNRMQLLHLFLKRFTSGLPFLLIIHRGRDAQITSLASGCKTQCCSRKTEFNLSHGYKARLTSLAGLWGK